MGSPAFPSNFSVPSSSTSSSKKFESTNALCDVLKGIFDQEFERKRDLDDKANTLMTAASTIAPIYGGSAVIGDKLLVNTTMTYSLVPLIFGLIALILSIVFSMIAIRIKSYHQIVSLNNFVEKYDEIRDRDMTYDDIKLKNIEIDNARDLKPDIMSNKLIITYLKTIVLNRRINDIKAKQMYIGQILFIAGMSSIPLFVALFMQKW